MRTFAFIAIFAFFFLLAPLTVVQAADSGLDTSGNIVSGVDTGTGLVNPLGTTDVKKFLLDILSIVTDTIGPVIVILMLVYVGFLFVAAQGNPSKIEAARGMLLWTVVGALILLGAKAIALGIQATVDALKV